MKHSRSIIVLKIYEANLYILVYKYAVPCMLFGCSSSCSLNSEDLSKDCKILRDMKLCPLVFPYIFVHKDEFLL